MQHESHTHGIDMAALGRDKQSLRLAEETVAIEVPGLSLFYGDKQALFDVSMNTVSYTHLTLPTKRIV